jgi:hypothetical protein
VNRHHRHTTRIFRSTLWVIALFTSFIEVLGQDFESNNLAISDGYADEESIEATKQAQQAAIDHYTQLASQIRLSEEDRKKTTNDILAEAFGFETSDPLFQDMLSKNFKFDEIREATAQIPDKEIIRHIQGDKGKSFPDAAKLAELEEKFNERNRALLSSLNLDFKQAELEAKKASEKALEQSMTPVHVPNCPGPKREKTAFADIAPGMIDFDKPEKNAPLVADILFLRIPPPADSDEFFGTKVNIFQITEDKGDAVSASFSKFGLECLPYRARIFAGYTEALYGEDALLNFDKDKKGKMHQLVQKRLDEFLK